MRVKEGTYDSRDARRGTFLVLIGVHTTRHFVREIGTATDALKTFSEFLCFLALSFCGMFTVRAKVRLARA